MANYTTAPAGKAEWSGGGYPGDTGNPTLTHVHRDGKWFCSADLLEAVEIADALAVLDILRPLLPETMQRAYDLVQGVRS